MKTETSKFAYENLKKRKDKSFNKTFVNSLQLSMK